MLHIHVLKTGGNWLTEVLERYDKRYASWGYLGYEGCGLASSWNFEKHRSGKSVTGYPRVSAMRTSDITSEWPWYAAIPKVSICRNPFDYLVSVFHHERNAAAGESMKRYHNVTRVPPGLSDINVVHGFRSFEEFVKRFCDPEFPFTSRLGDIRLMLFNQMFEDSGRCGIDYIIRNECLKTGTWKALKYSGAFGSDVALENKAYSEIMGWEKVNVSSRREKKDYRLYYTDELREMVEKKFLAELTLFEYDFDGIKQNEITRKMWAWDDVDLIVPQSLLYFHDQGEVVKNVPFQAELIKERSALQKAQQVLRETWTWGKKLTEECQSIYPDVFTWTPEQKTMLQLSSNSVDHKPLHVVIPPWIKLGSFLGVIKVAFDERQVNFLDTRPEILEQNDDLFVEFDPNDLRELWYTEEFTSVREWLYEQEEWNNELCEFSTFCHSQDWEDIHLRELPNILSQWRNTRK